MSETAQRQVPRGVATIELAVADAPLAFEFVVLPNASMQAFSSAIEPLRVLNQLVGRPLVSWRVVTVDGATAQFSCGLQFLPDGSATTPPRDAILMVCAGVEPEKSLSPEVVALVRKAWRHGNTVGGICTGAYTLAEAGILEGRAFTLHWENTESFELRYPKLMSNRKLYAIDGKIMTCSGGTASTDLILSIIRQRFGPLAANVVMEMCLHTSMRSDSETQRASLAYIYGVRNARFLRILEDLEDPETWDMTGDEFAIRHAISRRQMERLFKTYTGQSPQKYAKNLRLERARIQLVQTNKTIVQIAIDCGFASADTFSLNFKRRFNVSPLEYSKAFRHAAKN
ncbi:GlxA family transcriptional regulator [Pelagovum sp. HNIBRBA483]|uniref:GlxA family transcriptional regulator n=1 Tax=Pelagovum sp. HNIBRBA483 TaxID=3233341 RepID=UPI0034A57F35